MTTDCVTKQNLGGFWEDQIIKRCSFPFAPVNTFSNLAYVIAGLLLWHGPLAWKVESIFLIMLGISSGLFHGFKTYFTDKLDNAGMYLVYGALAVHALTPKSTFWGPLFMVLIGLILAWRFAFIPVPDNVEDILMGCFVGSTTIGVALSGSPWLALVSISSFGLAYWIWNKDKNKTFWWPKWGHGIWHMLTAFGTWLLFIGT